MYRSFTTTPSNKRVFGACLLSFMTLIAPIASVGAATLRATTPPVAKAELTANEKLEAGLFEPVPSGAPMPVGVPLPAITATKTDSFPVHPSGQAQPGDQITYDIAINNSSTDATNVAFNDTIDPNTTLVPGSLKVSPVAAADSYVAEQSVALSVGAPGVLTNDYGTPAPTVGGIVGCVDVTAPFTCTTTGGGTVDLAADGSFTYTPLGLFTGADTFTYTATNSAAGGLAPDDTATVTITVDARPTVTATTPTNGATNQTTSTDLTVTFSEAVNVTGTWFTISCSTSGAHTAAVTGGPTTYTLNPDTDFTQGETCTVTVVAAQVTDVDANDPPDLMAADYVFSFSMDAAPSVSTTTPTNGATGVPTNSDITVNFSESVSLGATPVTISCATSGAHTSVVSASPNTTFTVNPNVDFAQNELCTVTVLAAQVTDTDTADPPDNMVADYVFSFTTDAAPTVTATTPTNGATNQTTNTDIALTFSESVSLGATPVTISCTLSGAHTSVVSASPNTVFTVNPNVDFAAGETCTVTVLAAQVTDTDSGDPPDNMAANFVFSFSIDAAPTVDTTTPTNGAPQVANNTDITVNFSESVNLGATPVTISCATSGAHTSVVSASPNTVFTVNPDTDFANGELCTITVLAAQVTDNDANDPPDNMAANFVFSFTIDQPPSVTTTVPADLANDVAQSSTITINFSENVNVAAGGVTINCGVAQAFTPALPQLNVSSLVLTPTGGLPPGSDCTVTVVAANVTDTDSGDPPDNMVSNHVFTFKVKPDAVNDNVLTATTQTVIGNVSFNTANIPFSATTNDLSAAIFTVSAFDATSTNGGTVVMTTSGVGMGQFTYNPPRGFEGADTFNYTISRTDGGGSDTATVTINVSGMIWFIQDGAAACGLQCGRLSNPYPTLAAFNTDNLLGGLNPDNNDNIFIYEDATAYTGAVTLRSGQKLIGQDATATLASIAGVTVFSGSTALPPMDTGNGTFTNVNATVTLANNSQVIGLNMDGATAALSGTSKTGFTVNVNRFRRTAAGVALSLAGSGNTGNFTFKSLTAAGASGVGNKGITVSNLTGTFTVLGTDTGVTPNGGTVSGYGSNGMEFISVTNGAATSISLKNMTINGNGISETSASCGSDIVTANNLACVANLFLQSSKNISLDTVTITNSGQQGINGNAVDGLTIANSTIEDNGNGSFENGIILQNSIGTVSITGTSVRDNRARELHIANGSGTMTLNTSTSQYGHTAAGTGTADSQQGILMQLFGTSNTTIAATTLAFTNNEGAGFTTNAFHINADNGGPVVNGSISASTFSKHAAAVIVNAGGTANVTFDTLNNTSMTNTELQAVNYTILGGGAAITAKITGSISGNTITGCSPAGTNCHAIDMNMGTNHNGELHLKIDSNIITQTGSGIVLLADGAAAAGTAKAHLKITNNNLSNPGNTTGRAAIELQGGLTAANPNITFCTDVGGAGAQNVISGAWSQTSSQSGIFIRQRFSPVGSWVLPGYGGPGNNAGLQVEAYLNGRNTNTATPFLSTATTTTGAFANGGACVTPLMLASGGIESSSDSSFGTSNASLDSIFEPLARRDGTWLSKVGFIDEARVSIVNSTVATSLTQQQLDSIVAAVTDRWIATGLTAKQIAAMRELRFEVGDLANSFLGEASGNRIVVDRDAGGKGWFIDATPADDVEFGTKSSGTRSYTSPFTSAAGHVDLLTAIMHELGHRLGLADTYLTSDRDNLMYGELTVGERRLPVKSQASSTQPGTLKGSHFLSLSTGEKERPVVTKSTRAKSAKVATTTAPVLNPTCGVGTIAVCLGTLRSGRTVNIQFKVTINTPFPTTQVSNQGSVTYTESGTPVLTDDPSVGGSADPTVTPVETESAPVLDNTGDMSLHPINEDVAPAANPGTLVSDIIASADGDRITDADPGALEGLAVIAVDNTNGTWEFTINNGTNWIPFGSPDSSNARLLAADGNTRVRFLPNAGFDGTVDPGITFRAWDQTSGTNGNTADVTINGGNTAFSTATETASIRVIPVDPTQVQRTFVSARTGNDANQAASPACSITLPCRNFNAAISKTKYGGEVVALGSGDYAPVTITKAVTLTSPTTVYAAIQTGGGSAIDISAAGGINGDTVVLKGLTLIGLGGSQGLNVTSVGNLRVEGCVISGFFDAGIRVNLTAAGSRISINDTITRSNGVVGVVIASSAGLVRATIDNSRSEDNGIHGFNAGNNADVTINRSFAASNQTGTGFLASSSGAGVSSRLNCKQCVASKNVNGFQVNAGAGSTATIRVTKSMATNNLVFGFVQTGSGVFESLTNNLVRGNTSGNSSGTITPVPAN